MTHSIVLSGAAARRIHTLSEQAGATVMLRLCVEGGGCSGFQYKLDIVTQKQSEDVEITYDGAIALVDEVSIPLIDGSIIDYVDELIGSQFKILNPKASSSCGCGISFSI